MALPRNGDGRPGDAVLAQKRSHQAIETDQRVTRRSGLGNSDSCVRLLSPPWRSQHDPRDEHESHRGVSAEYCWSHARFTDSLETVEK